MHGVYDTGGRGVDVDIKVIGVLVIKHRMHNRTQTVLVCWKGDAGKERMHQGPFASGDLGPHPSGTHTHSSDAFVTLLQGSRMKYLSQFGVGILSLASIQNESVRSTWQTSHWLAISGS